MTLRDHVSLERYEGVDLVGLSYPIAAFLFVLGLWLVLTTVFRLPSFVLPSPIAVGTTIVDNAGRLAHHTLITLYESLLGLFIAVVFGVGFALAISASTIVRRTFYPGLVVLNALPKVALAPLFLIWFGQGFLPKLALAFLISFFPITINTLTGLLDVDPEFIELARIYHASPVEVYTKVRLPNALSYFFAGLKTAVTLAIIGAIVAEFTGAQVGIGYLIQLASYNINTVLVFAALIILGAMSLVLFKLAELLERWAMPWRESEDRLTR